MPLIRGVRHDPRTQYRSNRMEYRTDRTEKYFCSIVWINSIDSMTPGIGIGVGFVCLIFDFSTSKSASTSNFASDTPFLRSVRPKIGSVGSVFHSVRSILRPKVVVDRPGHRSMQCILRDLAQRSCANFEVAKNTRGQLRF